MNPKSHCLVALIAALGAILYAAPVLTAADYGGLPAGGISGNWAPDVGPPDPSLLQPPGDAAGSSTAGYSPWLFRPLYSVTADGLLMDRTAARSFPLARRATDQVELLNAADMDFPFQAGPRLVLRRQGDWLDMELVYFGIDAWRTTGRASDPEDVYFEAPGFLAGAFDGSGLVFNYDSRLLNVEANLRHHLNDQFSLLAGFRWMELTEHFTGGYLTGSTPDPFWTTSTGNHLWGIQFGLDGTVWQYGRFRIDGFVKAGVYGNHISTASALPGFDEQARAVSGRAAFVGELGLIGVYQVTQKIAVRGGYEAMWLDGVALAPDQIAVSNVPAGEIGVNPNTLFLHGAMVGMEIKF
jgi:hypothetical protein